MVFEKRRRGTIVKVVILKIGSRLFDIEQRVYGTPAVVLRQFSDVTVIRAIVGIRLELVVEKGRGRGATSVPDSLET